MTVNEYRMKHKRCSTCKHYRKAIFIYGFCKAKQQQVYEDTLIHRLRGCFCRIYEPEEYKHG